MTNRFTCRISRYNIDSTIGCYDSVEDASEAYRKAKVDYLKALAEKWKDKIDQRAYSALVNYGEKIND